MIGEVVHRAQHGDHDAFEQLLTARIDRMHATASLILRDRTLAEDAVQEACIRAWRSLPGLRNPERFDVWLRRVLTHACMDAARSSRNRRREHELSERLTDAGDVAARVADHDALERAFARLRTDHRAAFVLRHYLGHTVPEVADALGIPLGTAKSRLHHAERQMAAALNDDLVAAEGELA